MLLIITNYYEVMCLSWFIGPLAELLETLQINFHYLLETGLERRDT